MTHHSSALAIVAGVPLVIIAVAGAQAPPATPPQKAPTHAATLTHMDEHFARVREIQDAVVRGDLEGAKTPARWIADHQEAAGLPASAAVHVTAMKGAANAVAAAPDVRTAAQGAASLVAACGDCHAALKVTATMPSAVVVTAAPQGKQAHMAEHQHAINLLYRGLIGPSDADWKNGATGLKGAPLGAASLPEAKDATLAETRVHELAAKAVDAKDRGARGAAYGEVIGSCASCHGLHGSVWGPGAPKAE